jgi:Phasin protein
MEEDQEQFFKDLGATTEQIVEEVRGAEENYFSVIQMTTNAFPWIADLNKRLQGYAQQHFAAALEYAHKLSQAKDFEDLARIHIEYIQTSLQAFGAQAKDFADAYTKAPSGKIEAPLAPPS